MENVWNRLENNSHSNYPRNRERYHPYTTRQSSPRSGIPGRTRDSASSSEWRVKDQNRERHTNSDASYRGRSELSKEQNRVSPDSQRTISDLARRSWPKPYYRGRHSRSPPQTVQEWRPASKAREIGENHEHRIPSKALIGNKNQLERAETRASASRTERPAELSGQMQAPSMHPLTSSPIDTNPEEHRKKISLSVLLVSNQCKSLLRR